MCKTVLTLAAFGLIAGFAFDGNAQVYRCGDDYTNKPNQGESCVLVPGGNVTVLRPKTSDAQDIEKLKIAPESGGAVAQSDKCNSIPARAPESNWTSEFTGADRAHCRELTGQTGKSLTLMQLEELQRKDMRTDTGSQMIEASPPISYHSQQSSMLSQMRRRSKSSGWTAALFLVSGRTSPCVRRWAAYASFAKANLRTRSSERTHTCFVAR